MTVLAVLAPFVHYSSREFYPSMDSVWPPLSTLFTVLFIVIAAVMVLHCALFDKIKEWKSAPFISLAMCVLSIFCFTVATVFCALAHSSEKHIGTALLFGGIAVVIIYTLFVHSEVKKPFKHIIAGVLCLAVFVPSILVISDAGKFEFESNAVVFDAGEEYSVVFATSKKAIGFVEYTYEGTPYKVTAAENGKPTVGKIHAVTVPKEHLVGNTYSFGATYVKTESPYGAKTGKSITSSSLRFKGQPSEDTVTAYAFSDWHSNLDYLKTVSHHMKNSPDIIFMMGDSCDYLINDNDIINYIIKAGYILTKGEIPALFVRGNHETRGSGGHILANKLGLPSFYYRTTFGENLAFTVFDCGEDKSDTHWEYGGIAAYEPYMKEQLAWAKGLDAPTQAYHIALNHNPIYEVGGEETYHEEWVGELARMNTFLQISGHTHKYKLTDTDLPFWLLMDGGARNGGYIACELVFSSESVTINAYDLEGNVVDENTCSLVR